MGAWWRREGRRPLYTGEFVAFSPFDAEALRRIVRRIDAPFKTVIEVGSWLGNGSTVALVEELRGGRGVLYCVDTWRGNPNVERHEAIVRKYDVLATFRRNVEGIPGGREVVRMLVMTSREAAALVRDGTFDLVFLDADHSYESTSEDIRLWFPKVRPRGILAGHDCEMRLAETDRPRLEAARDLDSIEWSGRFPRIHPGVVLAVGEILPGCRLWSEEEITLPDGRRGRSTIWEAEIPPIR